MAQIENWLPKAVLDSPEYRTACTHRSAGSPHNERQEFLGDALLGLVISDFLCQRFPNVPEGDLSRLRAHLVCGTMLAKLAESAEMDQLLIAEASSAARPRARRAMAGNALEAVIAAVYQVCGFEEVRTFILRLYDQVLKELPPLESLRSAKTELQELLQARGRERARYTLLKERPKHSPRFEVQCEVKDPKVRTRGTGNRIREAEQNAAAAAIADIQRKRPGWTS